VQGEEGDEEPHSHDNEEQEAGDHGDLPSLRYEDVQDRQVSIQPANSFAPGAAKSIAAPDLHRFQIADCIFQIETTGPICNLKSEI
jgi:hypothetical protein